MKSTSLWSIPRFQLKSKKVSVCITTNNLCFYTNSLNNTEICSWRSLFSPLSFAYWINKAHTELGHQFVSLLLFPWNQSKAVWFLVTIWTQLHLPDLFFTPFFFFFFFLLLLLSIYTSLLRIQLQPFELGTWGPWFCELYCWKLRFWKCLSGGVLEVLAVSDEMVWAQLSFLKLW